MTSKIEVPRELLERAESILGSQGFSAWSEISDQLRALLTAPEAPRQEPEAWKITYADNGELHRVSLSSEQADRLSTDSYYKVTPLYAAPLSPDHSGGAGKVVDEGVEFERWWLRTPILKKGKIQIAQEAWEARACLDKVKELNQ